MIRGEFQRHSLAVFSSSFPSSALREMSVEELGISSKPASSPLSRVSTSGCGSHDENLNSSPGSPRCFFSSPEADLVREISTVELEISHLEQHLLSLYRTLFNGYLRNGDACHSGCLSLTSLQPSPWISSAAGAPPPEEKESQSSLLGSSKPISPHRRLASPAISSWQSESPCKLSEDIIKCISSVYAELAVSPSPGIDSSPFSSSTSSRPCLHDRVDSWSSEPFWLTPRRSLSKETRQEGPYGRMLEVSKISADGSRFASAASILQNYRVLISRLERTDPGELTRDEKLAFWVNVHNALVMHAFLAYGLRNHSSTRTSFSKAAYNVGGLTVNAREIRTSILRCQSNRQEPKMWTLFPSRSQKSTRVRAKHSYAVDQPEPLVHFALCAGAYSDPAVRVYSAMNVRRELEAARDEFLQSNVLVVREKKTVLLPKLLVNYAADASVDLPVLLDMVWAAMPEKCRKGGVETCSVDYFPYKSNFRYVIHGDLVQRVE